MKKLGLLLVRIFGLRFRLLGATVRGLPSYIRDVIKYVGSSPSGGAFGISVIDIYPIFADRFCSAGVANGHYFHQDLWAAKKIYSAKPHHHVDIGSRIDGFIAHLLVFMDVTVVDVRDLRSKTLGLNFARGNITNLKFADGSLESVSSLHAIEHIGLGRYGDDIQYEGWKYALLELQRVLKSGGVLYLGVPIGRERVCFNAHRVFDPKTICNVLGDLELISLSFVDDLGDIHEQVALEDIPRMEYGCGLFEFRKK